jgi:RNA polymerase sigma-70 factor, ECF subfamily
MAQPALFPDLQNLPYLAVPMEPTLDDRSDRMDLAALLARVAVRDRAAFATLYHETQAKLYGVIVRILARRDIAGEVLQEAYVRIWEKAADYDPSKGSAIAWMATIARNRALDEVRRAQPASIDDLPEGFEPAAEEINPLASRERSEALAALMRCLALLDPERRQVVLLAYYRGLTREALAKRFSRPVPTIKTWLRRSLSDLKDCLSS